jgi:hypothetical protein
MRAFSRASRRARAGTGGAQALAAAPAARENIMHKTSLFAALLATILSTSALADDRGESAAQLSVAALSASSVTPRRDDLDVPRRGRLVHHHGYYLAPTVGVTTLDGELAPLIGMRAAWLANRSFGLGFSVNGTINQLDEKLHYKGRALSVYGGLLVQYVLGESHILHGFIDTTIGGGQSCRQTGVIDGDPGKDDCHGKGFFMFEPMANLEINVARFMRVSLGAGYRVAVASNANELSSAQISGFVGKTALEFGSF